MNINRNNYEVYIMDYLDGNLSTQDSIILFEFLDKHPDLKEEFEAFKEGPKITQNTDTLKNKKILLKNYDQIETVTSRNFEELCAAYYEGDLHKKIKKKLKAWLKENPSYKADFELFGKIKYLPDYHIRYKGKEELQKGITIKSIKRPVYYAVSLAASALILVSIYLGVRNKSPKLEEPISTISAETEDKQNIVYAENMATNKKEVPEFIQSKQNVHISANPSYQSADNAQNLPKLERRQIAEIYIPETTTAIKPLTTNPHRSNSTLFQEKSSNSSLAKAENTLKQISTAPRKIKEIVKSEELSRQTMWEVAEKGIESINYLTEADIKLSRQTDENGRTKYIALNTESFDFQRYFSK